jgi:hypothetical protein
MADPWFYVKLIACVVAANLATDLIRALFDYFQEDSK